MDVLVLDSNKAHREVVRDQLVKEGHSVTESSGGFELLENISKFKKDIIVLDYDTWRKNRGVYRYFGVEKMWLNIPIIMIGKKKTDIFKEQNLYDKVAFIDKPPKAEELSAILKKHKNN